MPISDLIRDNSCRNTMTNMSDKKAGGAFLQLPKEVRDEIYGHYFNKSYRVLWSLCEEDGNRSLFRNVPDSETGDLADFAILRTCKGISSDAQDILYSKATTFIYVMRFDSGAIYTTPPAREATDRMMNVEFRVRIYRDAPTVWSLLQGIYDHEQHHFYSKMEATCGATLDRFAGTSVMRNSFQITLEIGSLTYDDSIGYLIESLFFQTLKKLIGFQIVTIVLISSVLAEYAPDLEARKVVRKVRKAFEPHLGPSIERVKEYTIDEYFGVSMVLSVEIDFEPRKFHIENLRADATRLSLQADGLIKEANRMIDEVHRLES